MILSQSTMIAAPAERIHGQHPKRIMRYTAVEPGRLIEFVPDSALIRFFRKAGTSRR